LFRLYWSFYFDTLNISHWSQTACSFLQCQTFAFLLAKTYFPG
jgi:hypothetical protein